MSAKKWITRAGATTVLVGFFLPAMLVSCSANGKSITFSLADLAGSSDFHQVQLYIVPIFAVVILALSFLTAASRIRVLNLLWGQASLFLSSLASIGYAVSVVYQRTLSTSEAAAGLFWNGKNFYDISPQFGAYILGTGFFLIFIGLSAQLIEILRNQQGTLAGQDAQPYGAEGALAGYPDTGDSLSSNDVRDAGPALSKPVYGNGARLELLFGSSAETIQLTGDNIMIGRGSNCQVHLPDPAVSREHARLRFAQGQWFIQDQNSSAGTLVNGVRLPAARLNSGDKIKLGSVTIVFRN